MRRSLEEQSDLAEEVLPASMQPTAAPVPPVPIIALWTGELARCPRGLEAGQRQEIEALAALCVLMGELAAPGESIEVEVKAGGQVLSAVALERQFVFMDYLTPGATREELRERAQREIGTLSRRAR